MGPLQEQCVLPTPEPSLHPQGPDCKSQAGFNLFLAVLTCHMRNPAPAWWTVVRDQSTVEERVHWGWLFLTSLTVFQAYIKPYETLQSSQQLTGDHLSSPLKAVWTQKVHLPTFSPTGNRSKYSGFYIIIIINRIFIINRKKKPTKKKRKSFLFQKCSPHL